MDIVHLPHDLLTSPKDQPEEIIFHAYTAAAGAFRGKSILHKNAISLVIHGKKTMHFADTTVHIRDDAFHFLSAGHCVVTMDLEDPFESILIFFDNKTLADFHVTYARQISALTKTHAPATEPYLAFQKDAFVRHFIASLQVLFRSGNAVSTEMKRLKFEELMLYLLENYPRQLLSFPLLKSQDFQDAELRRAVETAITTTISIGELAFLCNLSLSTFKRRFGRLYGTSPAKWLLQKRMERAKALIGQQGERPGEVYYKVGYENHSSFSQSFKQHFGLTPTAFQRQQLNDPQQLLNETP